MSKKLLRIFYGIALFALVITLVITLIGFIIMIWFDEKTGIKIILTSLAGEVTNVMIAMFLDTVKNKEE